MTTTKYTRNHNIHIANQQACGEQVTKHVIFSYFQNHNNEVGNTDHSGATPPLTTTGPKDSAIGRPNSLQLLPTTPRPGLTFRELPNLPGKLQSITGAVSRRQS